MNESQGTSSTVGAPTIPPEIVAAPTLRKDAAVQGEIVPAAAMSDVKAKMEFASSQASYITTYIALADTKAAWVFAIPAAAVTYLAGQPDLWTVLASPGHGWTKALIALTAILLLISAGFAFGVIVPRLSGAATGIVYFGAVAQRKSATAYLDDISPLSDADLADARISHNFELSRICARKYRILRKAMWSGLAALAVFLLLIAMLKLGQPAVASGPLSKSVGRLT